MAAFDRARRPERVAVVGLRATHRDARRPFPEGQRDRPGLGDVTDRGRRGVRVHVVDLGAVHAGVLQRDPGGTAGLAPVGTRLDHVVRVGGRPVAEQFRVRFGAARTDDVLGFQHEPRDALAHDEAVAVAVEGPRGTPRSVVVGRRQRPDDVEGAEREGAQRHLAAPGDRRIDPAVAQVPERLAEGHAPRGARVGRRQDRAAHVERDPEVGRGRAAEHRQREVRRHLADALVHVPLVLRLRVGDAAERAAEVDPDPLGARGVGGAGDEARVVEREPPGDEAELAEPVELPGDLRFEPRQRVEVVDLGRDLRAELGRIEAVDPPDRGAGGPQSGPEGVDARPDRRDHADPGHEHPCAARSCRSSSTLAGSRSPRPPPPPRSP